jgi:hypothetical protein
LPGFGVKCHRRGKAVAAHQSGTAAKTSLSDLQITVLLAETIRLMTEIDAQIEEHGGFPLAGSQIK